MGYIDEENGIYEFGFRLEELTLNDFKGHPNLNIKFDPQLTLIFGENGTGKTSIIRALDIFLNGIIEELIFGEEAVIPDVRDVDITNQMTGTFCDLKINFEYLYSPKDDEIEEADDETLREFNEEEFDSSVVEINGLGHYQFSKTRMNKQPALTFIEDLELREDTDQVIHEELKASFKRDYQSQEHAIPIFAIYGYNSKPKNQTGLTEDDSRITKLYSEIFSVGKEFNDFQLWAEKKSDEGLFSSLKHLENLLAQVNELKKSKAKIDEYKSLFIETQEILSSTDKDIGDSLTLPIEKILLDVINASSTQNKEMSNSELGVYKKIKLNESGNLIIQKVQNGITYEVLFEQLSAGEKIMIGIFGDIYRRLELANPHLKEQPNFGKGIIIIDEIDLHLHPRWQRVVLPKLLHYFPNIQFVITTHSPFVVQAADIKHFRMLKGSDIKTFEGEESNLPYEVILMRFFENYKRFDFETVELLKTFDTMIEEIYCKKRKKDNTEFVEILKQLLPKGDIVTNIVARELRKLEL